MRLPKDPGAEKRPADWKKKAERWRRGKCELSAGTGASPRPGPALQSWRAFNQRFPAKTSRGKKRGKKRGAFLQRPPICR